MKKPKNKNVNNITVTGPTFSINGREASAIESNNFLLGNLEAADRENKLLHERLSELLQENERLKEIVITLINVRNPQSNSKR